MLNMHGDLRRDSSSDCLGGVLDAWSDNPLPDFNPSPFRAEFLARPVAVSPSISPIISFRQ
jgi:hypothetical protein